MSESTPRQLLGIGNPLLDISAVVTPAFLDEYQLKINDALLAEERHATIYDRLMHDPAVTYTAGGATQNSIRLAQWLLPQGSTHYIGCIGNDEYGNKLHEAATADGVLTHYLRDDKVATGRCAVLIHEKDRCLVTQLGAANHYQLAHLQSAEIEAVLAKVSIVYSAGFFLTVSPPSLMHIAAHCHKHHTLLCGNISAPFIAQYFSEPLMAAMPFYDYLFGNESECLALGQKLGFTQLEIPEIALQLANLPVHNAKRPRHVVITQGSSATIVAITGQTQVQSFAVPLLDKSLIVDLNGAGDAFVGGFLSQLLHHKPLATCVHAGHYAARTIIQCSGVVLHGKPDFSQFAH